MTALQDWFRQLTAREQVYVLVAGAAIVLYLIFALVWKPVADMRNEMARRNAIEQERLSQVQALASEFQQLKGSGGQRRNRNMNRLINSSTADLGIRPSRISPNSRGETQIRFENVGFAELLRWLYHMEYGEGIAVKEVAINQGDRGGLVKATIRLGPG